LSTRAVLNNLQGNSNVDAKDTSPANTIGAITVGATDIADSRAYYSNFGPVVDVFAGGSNVTSTWNDGKYKTISGTSMATPSVAGLVAYFISTEGQMAPANMSDYIRGQATSGILSDIRKWSFVRLVHFLSDSSRQFR
jgi:cerevisin